MVLAVFLFIVGFVCLIKGGDWFVDGAVGIAERFHLPELLIGATIVSIGTTLPEVMVSAGSALSGHGEIAYGNAIGSVICNTALISAITAAVKPGPVENKSMRQPVIFFFIAAILYCAVAYTSRFFSRTIGIVLLAVFVTYMVLSVLQVMRNPQQAPVPEEDEENAGDKKESSLAKDLILLIVGAALIAVGARLLIDNGTKIAEALGVPESVIALTFVALGTSLPELITAITSLIKGHGSLSLGNVIGANLFNLVLVSGLSITLNPFSIPTGKLIAGHNASLVLDLPIMLFVMAFLTLPALFRAKVTRFQGVTLLVIYFAYCVLQFVI
ncbi:MAG: calcium/sodium antiporter [Clostridiales bacterium]|nr:calcium/sodium antiporter [Clostridiales bacterium]